MDRKGYFGPREVEWKPTLCFQLMGWLSSSCSRAHSAALHRNCNCEDNRCFQGFQMAPCWSRYGFSPVISSINDVFPVSFAVLLALDGAKQPCEGSQWSLSEQIVTGMHGSGQRHVAWIIRRVNRCALHAEACCGAAAPGALLSPLVVPVAGPHPGPWPTRRSASSAGSNPSTWGSNCLHRSRNSPRRSAGALLLSGSSGQCRCGRCGRRCRLPYLRSLIGIPY